jgi:hypothetical protein
MSTIFQIAAVAVPIAQRCTTPTHRLGNNREHGSYRRPDMPVYGIRFLDIRSLDRRDGGLGDHGMMLEI